MENNTEVLQKIKSRTTTQFGIFTSEYLPEENKNTNLKKYMHITVHYSIIYSSQDVEATYIHL